MHKKDCPKCFGPIDGITNRVPGEVSKFKQPPGSAMESRSGLCEKAPVGGEATHLWKFGKVSVYACNVHFKRIYGRQVARFALLFREYIEYGLNLTLQYAGFAQCSFCGKPEGTLLKGHGTSPALSMPVL